MASKRRVEKELERVKFELLLAQARGELATELRLAASHLEAALRYWNPGKSERSWII